MQNRISDSQIDDYLYCLSSFPQSPREQYDPSRPSEDSSTHAQITDVELCSLLDKEEISLGISTVNTLNFVKASGKLSQINLDSRNVSAVSSRTGRRIIANKSRKSKSQLSLISLTSLLVQGIEITMGNACDNVLGHISEVRLIQEPNKLVQVQCHKQRAYTYHSQRLFITASILPTNHIRTCKDLLSTLRGAKLLQFT